MRDSAQRRLGTATRRVLLQLASLVGLVIIGAVVWILAAYQDETITAGQGYGFSIGESREAAYATAMQKHSSREFFGMAAKREGKFYADDLVPMAHDSRDRVWDADEWVFFCSDPRTFSNSLRLRFADDHVVYIRRYRIPFEVP